jgi:hypothetical protein
VPCVAAIVVAFLLARSGRLSLRFRLRRNSRLMSIEPRGQLS